jgi:hypothetical protein
MLVSLSDVLCVFTYWEILYCEMNLEASLLCLRASNCVPAAYE